MSATQALAPVPLLKATRRVMRLALAGMLRTRRALFMLILFGAPVLIALAQRLSARGRAASLDLYSWLASGYYFGGLLSFDGKALPLKALPLAALFYAATLVTDEVEGHTLVYYICRPIARAALVVGKFAAYLVWTMTLTLASLGLVFLLTRTPAGMAFTDAALLFARDLCVALLALAAYGGLFAFVGVLLRRPVLPGLFFIYIWELGARLAGPLSHLTLSAHVETLLTRTTPPQELTWLAGPPTISATEALLVLGLVAVLGLAGASLVFTKREYVPDK
jgi:ABC-2 type transport system permease protein